MRYAVLTQGMASAGTTKGHTIAEVRTPLSAYALTMRCPVCDAAIGLRARYGMPGTDIGYAATRREMARKAREEEDRRKRAQIQGTDIVLDFARHALLSASVRAVRTLVLLHYVGTGGCIARA
eukprot:670998-Rhodomonas_salina.1